MMSRSSRPVAPRSWLRMPGPPPPPASSAAAAASWASWKAERFCGGAVEQHPRQHLVLWQLRLGGEGDVRLRHPAVDGDDGGDVLGHGARDEVDLRVEVADELQRALVEVDALAEDQQPPAAHLELADRLHVGGGALQPEVAAELDVEAAAAHEDLVRRVDPQVEADAVAVRWPRPSAACRPWRGRASAAPAAGSLCGRPGRAPPGRWRRGPRPPRSRCARGRCCPASRPPPPKSGPVAVSAPSSRVLTKAPSV